MSLRSKIATYTDNHLFMWSLLGLIVLVALFYIYAVNRTVVLVAQREAIESKINANRAVVSELESTYIAQKSYINMDLVASLGYGVAKNVVFVPKKSVSILPGAQNIQ